MSTPNKTSMIDAASRSVSWDSPSTVGNNPNRNAISAKVAANPRVIKTGRAGSRCPTETPRMIGSIGSTQGAATVRTPAVRASTISSMRSLLPGLGRCDAGPDHRLDEQRQPDIRAKHQLVGFAERYLAGIGLGVLAIVDLARPFALTRWLEVLEEDHAEGIALVDGDHLATAGHGAVGKNLGHLAAERFTAMGNLDFEVAAIGQPGAEHLVGRVLDGSALRMRGGKPEHHRGHQGKGPAPKPRAALLSRDCQGG